MPAAFATTSLAWRPHYALKPCPDRATTKKSWRGLIAEGRATVAEPFGGNGDCSPAHDAASAAPAASF